GLREDQGLSTAYVEILGLLLVWPACRWLSYAPSASTTGGSQCSTTPPPLPVLALHSATGCSPAGTCTKQVNASPLPRVTSFFSKATRRSTSTRLCPVPCGPASC